MSNAAMSASRIVVGAGGSGLSKAALRWAVRQAGLITTGANRGAGARSAHARPDASRRAGEKTLEESMTTPHGPVVVGLDPDPAHRLPLAWAADEAKRRHLSLRVVLAEGYPTIRVTDRDLLPSWDRWNRTLHVAGERALDEAVAFVEARHPGLPVSVLLAEGEAPWVLRDQAHEAAMVVLGSKRLSAVKELFSSAAVALPVIVRAPCPVVVVREPEYVQERPYFVVGVDGSPTSEAAIDFAFEEAALRGAALRALYVWHPPPLGELDEDTMHQECRRALAEAVSGRVTAYPDVEVHHEVVRGHPVDVLTRESTHALGLIVGTRGHGGFTGMLLGSVSQGLLHHAQCPLITVAPSAAPPRGRGG